MIRAAIYTRFSTDKQSEASLADQERICRIRAAAQSWEVVAVHGDDGVSGSTPVAAREGGRALREALPELDEMVSMQAASGMVHVARMTERERARREQADRDWAAGR